MSYQVKLKTGFYETTLYDLSLSQDKIQFIPLENTEKEVITIKSDDLITITLTKRTHSEIEVLARNRIFTGTFIQDPDLRELQKTLKKYINTKIIYEEE